MLFNFIDIDDNVSTEYSSSLDSRNTIEGFDERNMKSIDLDGNTVRDALHICMLYIMHLIYTENIYIYIYSILRRYTFFL